MADQSADHVELAAGIVSAYVSHNSVRPADLPTLIGEIHSALTRVSVGLSVAAPNLAEPAVSPKKSVANDYIICLEDGQRFKSLKRHLRVNHKMSPDDYRKKWDLPASYPMVAPAYAKARSTLAKKMGLGRKPGDAATESGDSANDDGGQRRGKGNSRSQPKAK